jgi:ubiquinone/menaquinone biosynthesis C-methylase UbiE
LPYSAGTFHAVISLFSLHCWRHVPDAVLEMARVLTLGGVLIISDLTADDLAAYHGGARRIARLMFENSPAAVDYYRWLDSAGLRVLEAESTLSGRHGLFLSAEKVLRRTPLARPAFHDSGEQP